MKVNEIHIGDPVATTDSPTATVYEVVSLIRNGSNIVAGLREVGNTRAAFLIDIAALQRATIDQITQIN